MSLDGLRPFSSKERLSDLDGGIRIRRGAGSTGKELIQSRCENTTMNEDSYLARRWIQFRNSSKKIG